MLKMLFHAMQPHYYTKQLIQLYQRTMQMTAKYTDDLEDTATKPDVLSYCCTFVLQASNTCSVQGKKEKPTPPLTCVL